MKEKLASEEYLSTSLIKKNGKNIYKVKTGSFFKIIECFNVSAEALLENQ